MFFENVLNTANANSVKDKAESNRDGCHARMNELTMLIIRLRINRNIDSLSVPFLPANNRDIPKKASLNRCCILLLPVIKSFIKICCSD